MKINENTFRAMPVELQSLFSKCSNPSRDEVTDLFPFSKSCNSASDAKPESKFRPGQGNYQPQGKLYPGDAGSAARFFYCAKTPKKERGEGNNHPTVKPLALMRYLCRLVTQKGGKILDPFTGSGSTGVAAIQEGFQFIGVEKDEAYLPIASKRISEAFAAQAAKPVISP